MKDILTNYVGQEIGINLEKPFRIDSAKLKSVSDEHFSVIDKHHGYTHHFAYQSVVQIIEGEGGIDIGGLFTHKEHHNVIVKVGHLVEYIRS